MLEQGNYRIMKTQMIRSNLVKTVNPGLRRKNCDSILNTEGIKLIELCKALDLVIINGRSFGDHGVSFTHYNKNKGASLVDLAISPYNLFDKIEVFRVSPQTEISDHCKITLRVGTDKHTLTTEQTKDG